MVREADKRTDNDTAEVAAAELLAIDIGNSTVHLGAVRAGKTIDDATVESAEPVGLDDAIRRIWARLDDAVQRVIVASSVAPEVLERVETAIDDATGEALLVVGREIGLPIPIVLDNPQAVGVDRVCAAAAAHAQLNQACVVAGFGTAIKIDLMSDDGVFMGGTILPGLRLSALALAEHTAALPLVKIHKPTHPWGRDTREAINNGIFYAAIGALREIAERYATEVGRWLPLVVTGGAAELVAKHADFVDHVVPDLTLRGIALAYDRARDRQDG